MVAAVRGKRQKAESVFRIVAPQDGGWSLLPMENFLRGLRNHEDMVSLEIYGVDGVVNYGLRTQHGGPVAGMLSSFFPQAEVSRRDEHEFDNDDETDWLHLNEGEVALVQPLGLERESYLPLRVDDDRTLELSKVDPLAGIIGVLSNASRTGHGRSDRLGVRVVLKPAAENWNAPWQKLMQARRDGDDRQRTVGTSSQDGGGSTLLLTLAGLGAFAGGNYLLWDQANIGGMVLFNGFVALAAGGGLALYRKYGGQKKRFYMDEELVEKKLKSLAFWSEVQIVRIFGSEVEDMAERRNDAWASLDEVLDCLRAFDDPAGNSWLPGKVQEFDQKLVQDGRGRRHIFVGGGGTLSWLDPKRAERTALSAREAASLWHPPLGMDEMASMERSAAGLLAPYLADLGSASEDAGPMVGLARSDGQSIRLPESALRKHSVILGRSGVGKSTFIKHVVEHKLRRKAAGVDNDAIVVIDPHADLVRDILKLVPSNIADKVRLLDFGRNDRVPGLNLVDPYLFPDRDRCVDTIVETVKHLWDHWGGRLEDLLKRSLMIIYEFNSHHDTPRDKMLTMLDILPLLDGGEQVGSGRDARTVKSEFQRDVFERVTDPSLVQWFDAYLGWDRSLRAEATGPVHSRIGAYAANQRASVVMGQRESTIMLSDVVSEGLVLLVSTAQGSVGVGPAALMGGTMVSLVESALRDQESVGASERKRCLLVCDEFQTVTGANWEGLLAEIRKYGCSLMLATQSLARLDSPERRLKAGVLGNVGCIVGYQMAAEDARIIAPEMDSERVQERNLVNLHPHHCYIRLNSDKKCYPAFSMATLPPPDIVREESDAEFSRQAVLAASEAYTIDFEAGRQRMKEEVEARIAGGKIGGGESKKAGGSVFDQVAGKSKGDMKLHETLDIDEEKVKESPFTPDILAMFAERIGSDPALRNIADKNMARHIKSERKKARRDVVAEMRAEIEGEFAAKLAELENAWSNYQETLEKDREAIRVEAEAKARADMAVAIAGVEGSEDEVRDYSKLRKRPS